MHRSLAWALAAAPVAVALLLGLIAYHVPWASSPSDEGLFGDEVRYGTTGFEQGEDVLISVPYGSDFFDDQDGIGQLRAAAPLLVTGLVLLGATLLAAEHAILLGRAWIGAVATLAAVAAFVLMLLALILLPTGIAANLEWDIEAGSTAPGTEPDWGAGLVLQIIATAFALVGAVLVAVLGLRGLGGLRITLPTPIDDDGNPLPRAPRARPAPGEAEDADEADERPARPRKLRAPVQRGPVDFD